jgi:hypothetical protein
MRLKTPRKNWKEATKEKKWITYYGCIMISIKSGVTCHGAFFEQCPKFDIVFLQTSNDTKK